MMQFGEHIRIYLVDIVMVDATHSHDITPQLTALPCAEFCRDLENRMRDDLGYPANLHIEYELLDAVKYSHPGYPITVTLALADTQLIVVVTDQGIGIPAHDLPGIFQLFYRGSNVSTRSGLGLGLYIVDKLVHVMGGTVTVESPGADQRSTFRVVVPVKIGQADVK